MTNSARFELGPLTDRVNSALEVANAEDIARRIWRKDASLWKSDDESAKVIKNALGWLTVADEMIGAADELVEFAESVRARGFRHVMVCGMGGSSLCPEVLAQTFGPQPGFPELLVLDSTDPDVIAAFADRIDIEHCLFIIASKSGSTTEPNVFYKFWYDQLSQRSETPGDNFVAITDPGSPLVDTAAELKFHTTFLNQADIGGRYSALSYFGMVPAALMGLDVRRLLERARQVAQAEKTDAALQLGVTMGECANAGRDKLTLVLDPALETLGLWIEQLVAESTGKEDKGILPVNGELLGAPDVYGNDRLFVAISLGAISRDTQSKLDALTAANHPVVYRSVENMYDLGAEFFEWEFATACAGWRLGINPFDQPNVQEAKDATKEVLSAFVRRGRLEERNALISDDLLTLYGEQEAQTVVEVLRSELATIKPGDYIAFLNYVEETTEIDELFQQLRTQLRDTTKCAVTVGYGPRFLHSTGQLHKGGPDTGVFFQIVANDETDFPIPGESYTFSILKQAQARGDFQALQKRGRRAIAIELGPDTMRALTHLAQLIQSS